MNRDPIVTFLEAEAVLQPALAALAAADAPRARDIAGAVLAQAESTHQHHRRAKALLLLGHIDRLASRFRDAHERCGQAVQLFRSLGDAIGESAALSTLAHASTCLGRNEEAVESALISVRLAENTATSAQQAMLFNYLGVAYLWSRDVDKARSALDQAVRLAEASGGDVGAFQPLINQLLNEMLHAVSVRYQSGTLPSLEVMMRLQGRCEALTRKDQAACLFAGAQFLSVAVGLFTSALCRTWTGDFDAARDLLQQVKVGLAGFPTKMLAHAFEQWVHAELAWAQGDLRQAVAQCEAMIELSRQLEYEQMTCLGYLLLSQIHEQLGEPGPAFDAMRQLRRREQMIRNETLSSRERAVQWNLDLRLVKRDVQQLQGMSRHLERLSLEDPLTGLANRRCLEQRLASTLSARSPSGAPMSIAFLDVDDFKRVNDQHSHRVGDLVLRAIAGLLSQCTREHDLAVRLSGDEFAILFQRADVSEATGVCQRISAAVAEHDWRSIAPGLAVTVSIGTAAAHEGDSVESLLHRGDSAMYAAKRLATQGLRRI